MLKSELTRIQTLMKKIPYRQWMTEREDPKTGSHSIIICVKDNDFSYRSVDDTADIVKAFAIGAFNDVLQELAALQKRLSPLIALLDDPEEKAIMQMRYINGMGPTLISRTIGKTERMVFYLLKRAEQHIGHMNEKRRE